MNSLDDFQKFSQIDPHNMLGEINNLPSQLEQAWQLGNQLPLPPVGEIRQVLIAGMGGVGHWRGSAGGLPRTTRPGSFCGSAGLHPTGVGKIKIHSGHCLEPFREYGRNPFGF